MAVAAPAGVPLATFDSRGRCHGDDGTSGGRDEGGGSGSGRARREDSGSGGGGGGGGGGRDDATQASAGGRGAAAATRRISVMVAGAAAVVVAAAAAVAVVGGGGGGGGRGGGGRPPPPTTRQAARREPEPTKEPYPLADVATTYWTTSENFPLACQAITLSLRGTTTAAGRPGVSFLPGHALESDGAACGVAPAATTTTGGGAVTAGTGVGLLLTTRAAMLSAAAAASAGVSDLYAIAAANTQAYRVVAGITFLDMHVAVARDGSLWCPPTAVAPLFPRGTVALLMRLGWNDTVNAPGLGFTLRAGDAVVWAVHPSGLSCVFSRPDGSTDGRLPPAAAAAAAGRPPVETLPPEPPAGPTPAPAWGYQCFPADAGVRVRGRRGVVPMEALRPGDAVPCAGCADGWSRVYAFGHATPVGVAPFVAITAAPAGGNASAAATAGAGTEELVLTGGHYVAVGGGWRRADTVAVGDTLTGMRPPPPPLPGGRPPRSPGAAASVATPATAPSASASAWALAPALVGAVLGVPPPPPHSPPTTTTWVVTATRVTHRRGLYAPLTMGGELGVGAARLRVSAYAVPPAVGAAVTAPLRAAAAAGVPVHRPVAVALEGARRLLAAARWVVAGGEGT